MNKKVTMKANEFRIGNLIYLELGVPSLDIHTIVPYDLMVIERTGDKAIPIPLTEEWLKKFGFYMIYYDKEKEINYKLNDFTLEQTDGGFIYQKVIIKYIHQLQNLYFALTGEELTKI